MRNFTFESDIGSKCAYSCVLEEANVSPHFKPLRIFVTDAGSNLGRILVHLCQLDDRIEEVVAMTKSSNQDFRTNSKVREVISYNAKTLKSMKSDLLGCDLCFLCLEEDNELEFADDIAAKIALFLAKNSPRTSLNITIPSEHSRKMMDASSLKERELWEYRIRKLHELVTFWHHSVGLFIGSRTQWEVKVGKAMLASAFEAHKPSRTKEDIRRLSRGFAFNGVVNTPTSPRWSRWSVSEKGPSSRYSVESPRKSSFLGSERRNSNMLGLRNKFKKSTRHSTSEEEEGSAENSTEAALLPDGAYVERSTNGPRNIRKSWFGGHQNRNVELTASELDRDFELSLNFANKYNQVSPTRNNAKDGNIYKVAHSKSAAFQKKSSDRGADLDRCFDEDETFKRKSIIEMGAAGTKNLRNSVMGIKSRKVENEKTEVEKLFDGGQLASSGFIVLSDDESSTNNDAGSPVSNKRPILLHNGSTAKKQFFHENTPDIFDLNDNSNGSAKSIQIRSSLSRSSLKGGKSFNKVTILNREPSENKIKEKHFRRSLSRSQKDSRMLRSSTLSRSRKF